AQRDLGTASLFVVLFTVMLFMATEKRRYVALILVGMILALVVGYRYFDVVRLRIDAWINPWQDADGRAYQIVQSLIAIASGEFLGRGPGMGSPALVPVTHSDFIFAAIAEEFGMVGMIAIVALLALFAFRGLRVALRAADPYQRYLAAGLTCYLTAQSVLIIGGNLRLLPLTGITLPFVSYGGSSLMTSFIALLLLVQISGQTADNASAVRNPRPVLYLGAGFLAALAGIALLGGWWAIVRSADLTARKDNLRPAISEFYTPRGDILDRHDAKISTTIGNPGDYTRSILYPALSPIIGYANLDYGQTGLELDLNPVLRGLQGNSALTVWWTDLLYGQLPRGLDVRLTLDLKIQQIADQQLEGHSGAAVLLNASSGEILAIASHPGFDANRLAETWNTLIDDPTSPLLNRASAGQYPLGTALGPFALASVNLPDALPSVPQPLDVTLNGHRIGCTQAIVNDVNWGSAVAAGCPTPLIDLSSRVGAGDLKEKLTALGFYTQPEIPLLTPDPKITITTVDDVQLRLGLDDLHVSPLQVALAASAISASGQVPAAQIVNAVRAPDGSWDAVQDGPSTNQALLSSSARKAA
ncbi:MAG TPA: FtsW/RodA/SpoVE family cell cycle protein, partial [Anaerolineaceae bacterium]|nr:FtsW/RodA/SpoVE family cell cycle protein [Anaerolineaceae bacterium]